MKREIPIEVSREINNFAGGMEGSEKVTMIREHENAYLDMVEKLEKAEIPAAEKEGIMRNVKNMFPGNYVRQNIEATSMIDIVLTAKANM